LAAQRVVEVEPNDLASQAQTLTPGRIVHAQLSTTADVDWYAFSLPCAQQVNVRALPADAAPADAAGRAARDTLVAIYDGSGETRLAWNDRSNGAHSDCGVTLPAGDYTCLVALKPTGAPGDYVVELLAREVRPIEVGEGPEPNDNPAHGGTPMPITLGCTIGGEIADAGDADWFTFVLERPGIVQVVCLDDGGVPQLDNTRLQFWRETSPGLWSAFGIPSFVRTSHRAFDLSHTTNLPAGNYLMPGHYAIQVDANTSTPTGSAPWNYHKVGKYALRTGCIELPGLGPTAETAEPNGTAGRATPFSLGQDARGTIDDHGDTDWYRFEIDEPTTLGATAEGVGGHAVPVTSVRLWSDTGTALASGTGTSTAHGKLVHTLAQPGVYFLEVKGRRFSDTGSYVLHTGSCRPLHLVVPPLTGSAASTRAIDATANPRTPSVGTGTEPRTRDRSN